MFVNLYINNTFHIYQQVLIILADKITRHVRINNLSINTTFSCLILYTPTFNYFLKVFVFRRFRYIMSFTLFICISVENRLLILRHACNCG